jgi:hypothetical protein
MRRNLMITLLIVLAAAALVACGGSDEDPAVAFCSALTELNETGPTIAALGEAADLAQIVQLGSAMDNNWRDLSSAATGMDDATQAAFAPYDEQYTSIPAITQETAMAVARTSLDAKNAIATEAYAELYPANCQ